MGRWLSDRMNPATLLRLYRPWADPTRDHRDEVHVLAVSALSGAWPQTVYRAAMLGYFHRTAPGMVRPTPRLTTEVTRVQRVREVQAAAMRFPDRVAERPALGLRRVK